MFFDRKLLSKEKKTYVYGILYRKTTGRRESLIYGDRGQFSILAPDLLYWYADPILFLEPGKKYPDIYMEACGLFGRGCIAKSSFDENGKISRPRIVLKEPFHLSFPHIFEYDNSVYMIPETSQVREIRIYKKTENRWDLFYSKPVKEFIVDTCTVRIGKDVLLISGENIQEKKTRTIFHRLTGLDTGTIGIEKLSMDDINEYTRTERNAGSIIEKDGNRYRVKQVSTDELYGVAVDVFKIKSIGFSSYDEERYGDITIDKVEYDRSALGKGEIVGTHTYGLVDEYEVMDVAIKKYTFIMFLKALKRTIVDFVNRK